jgi:hypothetical protein
MYKEEGERRRAAWIKLGRPACHHPQSTAERSFGGVLTGYAVCTTCGGRMRTLYADGQPSGRKSVRVPKQSLLIVSHREGRTAGQLLDLSMQGCQITAPLSVKEGQLVQLLLLLHASEALELERAIVQWHAMGRFGVQFLGMEEREICRLEKFLSNLHPDSDEVADAHRNVGTVLR